MTTAKRAAMLALSLALTGCGKHDADGLVLHGNVEIRQVSLAFEGSGRITAFSAQEGDAVHAGDSLATLDTTTLRLQADQIRAQVAAQEQQVARLLAGSRPEEIAQAQASYAAARAEAERSGDDLARLRAISDRTQGKGLSTQDIDHATREAAATAARADQAEAALRLARIGPRREDIAQAQAQLQAARAQLAQVQHQIDLGTLHAPADAVVHSRLLEPGDMASAQRPVFALALTHPKWVRVFVGEGSLGRVHPGQAARVTTDTPGVGAIAGKVGYIASVAEFTPKSVETEDLRTDLVYEVRVIVQDPQDRLRLGQPVTVALP